MNIEIKQYIMVVNAQRRLILTTIVVFSIDQFCILNDTSSRMKIFNFRASSDVGLGFDDPLCLVIKGSGLSLNGSGHGLGPKAGLWP
jgi:hypothetical protein